MALAVPCLPVRPPVRPPARPPRPSSRPPVRLSARPPLRRLWLVRPVALPPVRAPARPLAPPPALLAPPGFGLRVVVLPCAGSSLVLRLPSSSPWGLPLRSPPLLPVFLGVLLPSPRPRLPLPPCRSRFLASFGGDFFRSALGGLFSRFVGAFLFVLRLYVALAYHATGRDAGPCLVCRRVCVCVRYQPTTAWS